VSTATGRTDWALAEASAPATSVSAVLLATMATANWPLAAWQLSWTASSPSEFFRFRSAPIAGDVIT
jgi:hypothetical protein